MKNIDAYYPASPHNVPEDLTLPSGQYKSRVLFTLCSLILFFILYLGLIAASLVGIVGSIVFLKGAGLLIAIPLIFFVLFLIKNFFKRNQHERSMYIEVTADDQPRLFAFIERLCEETGAPRPRKVFVSPEVNAAVISDTSVLSLVWPPQRDLLIGLGLVNVLNLSEFKAVLAHEFGHFSQSSLKVGSYVYVANRIIVDMVGGRDWFDTFLDGWARVDLRISWIAWILKGIIWLFRKILEGFFNLINLLSLSLSREQEFHADLVAVSVAGSDAGIHALSRLTFAEETWGQGMGDLRTALDHKLYSADIFHHLNHAANFLRKQKKDPLLGIPPPLPADVRETPDLFKPEDDEHLQMWSTHPSHYDREQNAKQYYIRSPIDDRSAWVLFKDPQKVREDVSYQFYNVTAEIPKRDLELADPDEVQAFIDDEHAETTYDPRYHGVYDDRFIEIKDIDDLVSEAKRLRWPEGKLDRTYLTLYSDELKTWMEGYTSRRAEFDLLRGLSAGELELKGDDLEFRGRKYDPEDAERLLKKVDKELEADRDYFADLDRRVFVVTYQMALHVDPKSTAELTNRYDFHLICQDLLRKVRVEREHLEAALVFVSDASNSNENHFPFILKACRDAHKALTRALDTADDLPMPSLKNMKKGKPLGAFLLDKRLVHRLGRDESMIKGEWIGRFLTQMSEVLQKLQRIHFKSLGGILILQDWVYQEWKRQLAAMPVAESALDPALPVDAPPEMRLKTSDGSGKSRTDPRGSPTRQQGEAGQARQDK